MKMNFKREAFKTCKQNYHKDTQNPQLSHNRAEDINPQRRWSYH